VNRQLAILIVGVFLASVLPAARSAEAPSRNQRPNIVFVLADDLGANDLACYGRQEHATPNLNRLAQQGMRFTCAYGQPICSPSRAALLTGKSPARLNLTNYLPGRPNAPSQRVLQPRIEGQLPLEEVTLAEVLKDAGYATGMFGKWHLGNKGFGPEEQGFAVAVVTPPNSEPLPATGGKNEFTITGAAEKFIAENRDRPFFCYVAHHCPHIPLSAVPETVDKHETAFNPKYAAMIETLDEAVGRLMAKVESLGLADHTIFIFTSDNGGLHVRESPDSPATHNTPFRAGKGYLYEGGIREPLIVRWPGVVAAGSICDTPVQLMDFFPTLLTAAGIDPAAAVGPVDGVNILPLLHGESLASRARYWHLPNYTNQGGRPASAIREGGWKLVECLEDGSIELFDLQHDAGETKNLAESEPERAADLRNKLHAWRESSGARMPAPNPEFDESLHRQLYVEQDPSRLVARATAAETAKEWKTWRERMREATKDCKPAVTPAAGDVRLQARDAHLHGKTLRYESQPNKNVLGYWTNVDDWVEWEFVIPADGIYEVEIQQGCGKGSGGAEVAVAVDDQSLKFTVHDTGGFQQMIQPIIGKLKLTRGKHRLAIRPQTKPGAAVMDLRRVVLRPAVAE
jgi:arylsulfatase A-like enzyme